MHVHPHLLLQYCLSKGVGPTHMWVGNSSSRGHLLFFSCQASIVSSSDKSTLAFLWGITILPLQIYAIRVTPSLFWWKTHEPTCPHRHHISWHTTQTKPVKINLRILVETIGKKGLALADITSLEDYKAESCCCSSLYYRGRACLRIKHTEEKDAQRSDIAYLWQDIWGFGSSYANQFSQTP